MGNAAKSPYELASEAAARLGIALAASELATLASDHDMGDAEVGALAVTFDYLAEKRRQASIETLLRLSRLPRREPKTFDGFDFSRTRCCARSTGCSFAQTYRPQTRDVWPCPNCVYY
jgi:hypothetical protein